MQIQKVGIIILRVQENKGNNICTVKGVENVNNILKDFWNTINNKEKVSQNVINDDNIYILEIENKKSYSNRNIKGK